MAAIFRDFSFIAASRQPSPMGEAVDHAAMNVSPTTVHFSPAECPPRLPAPPSSVGDLAIIFDKQSLCVDVDPAYRFTSASEPLTPPSDNFFKESKSTTPSPRPSYSRFDTAALRFQRQVNTKMQCSASHAKDISKLVQRMIEEENQCHTCEAKPSPRAAIAFGTDEDEGVDIDSGLLTPPELSLRSLKFRRSGDSLHGCAAVSRVVRMRKRSKVVKRHSR